MILQVNCNWRWVECDLVAEMQVSMTNANLVILWRVRERGERSIHVCNLPSWDLDVECTAHTTLDIQLLHRG